MEALMQGTISKIERLPATHVREVNDFVEFIVRRADDAMITEGLQQLTSCGNTCDFMYGEPELYTVNDLKVRYV